MPMRRVQLAMLPAWSRIVTSRPTASSPPVARRQVISKVTFTKADLDVLGSDAAAYVVQMGLVLEEVTHLLKMSLMCKCEAADPEVRIADIALNMRLLRRVAAALVEGGKACFSEATAPIRASQNAEVGPEVLKAEARAERYLRMSNRLESIRNDLTYHVKPHGLEKAYGLFDDDEPFSVYWDGSAANFNSTVGHALAGYAMLGTADQDRMRARLESIRSRILWLSRTLYKILSRRIELFLAKVPSRRSEEIVMSNLPDIRELRMTHYTRGGLPVARSGSDERGIRLEKTTFTKRDLTAIGMRDLLFAAVLGQVLTELGDIGKAFLMAGATHQDGEEADASLSTHRYWLCKQAGMAYEGWKAIEHRVFRDCRDRTRAGLSVEAVEAEKELKAYFGINGQGKSRIRHIRKTLAFHLGLDELRKFFNQVKPELEFSLFIGRSLANFRFSAGDVVAGFAMLGTTAEPEVPVRSTALETELRAASRNLLVLGKELHRQLVERVPGRRVESIEVGNIPLIDDMPLPHFTQEPDPVVPAGAG